jgi:zinc transporter 1/2/3
MFIIFVAGMLGGLPGILLKRYTAAGDTSSYAGKAASVLRAFAAGTILSLAIIHVLPEAYEQLEGFVGYSWGGVAAVGGVVVLACVESLLQARVLDNLPQGQSVESADGLHGLGAHHGHHTLSSNGKAAAADAAAKQVALEEGVRRVQVPQPHHHHACLHSTPDAFVASAAGELQNVRQYLAAYTMELGCIFHSVIIGVSIGVILDSMSALVAMIIAISFHQMVEGLSLGSILARAPFGMVKQLVMLTVYALTTPLGIAVGIGVAHTYDPDSTVARAVQGSLNGVSGGMLLYMSIYQLIGEEFSNMQLLTSKGWRWGLYAALVMGTVSMAVLGIWA